MALVAAAIGGSTLPPIGCRTRGANRLPPLSSPSHFVPLAAADPPDESNLVPEYNHSHGPSSFGMNCCRRKKRYVRRTTKDQGKFQCLVCNAERIYKHKQMTLVQKNSQYCRKSTTEDDMSMMVAGDDNDHNYYEYVKCTRCGFHFDPKVLEWTQGPEKKKQAFEKALLSAMIRAVSATTKSSLDQWRNETVATTVCSIYQDMTKKIVTHQNIVEEANRIIKHHENDHPNFKALGLLLDSLQKDTLIKAMSFVFLADGNLKQEEAVFLAKTGNELCMEHADVKKAYLQALLATKPINGSTRSGTLDETNNTTEDMNGPMVIED